MGKSAKKRQEFKMRLKEYFNFICQSCSERVLLTENLHLDHKIPKSRGGSEGVKNFSVLCSPCNMYKGNKYGSEISDRALIKLWEYEQTYARLFLLSRYEYINGSISDDDYDSFCYEGSTQIISLLKNIFKAFPKSYQDYIIYNLSLPNDA